MLRLARDGLREVFRTAGLEERIGAEHFFESIEDGVAALAGDNASKA